MESAVSKIKQPEPSVLTQNSKVTGADAKNYKVIQYNNNIGVVNTPKISRTPIRDMLEIKRRENPYTVYKLKFKEYIPEKISSIASAGIILCGIASLLKFIKKSK